MRSWVRDCEPVLAALEQGGFDVRASYERVDAKSTLSTALDRAGWEVVIYDPCTAEVKLDAVLVGARQRGLHIPVIVLCRLDELSSEIARALRAF